MYLDLHTDQGKHLHIEFPHVFGWIKSAFQNVTKKRVSSKPTFKSDAVRDPNVGNFHADQTYQHRHSRTYIGPL